MKKRFIILITLFFLIFLIFFNEMKAKEINNEMKIKNNTIYLDSLTLKQKIAQMFIIRGDEKNLVLTELNVGGVALGGLHTKKDYQDRVRKYQEKSEIKLLVAADLEGYWNPFSDFSKFPYLDEIETEEEAYLLGKSHGEILKELGFNINFAPVAEIEDKVWKHRAFNGNTSEISDKVNFYIKGIQEEGIKATIKHYPGGSLSNEDPHKYLVYAKISDEQLKVFDSVLENVSAVMIGHAIVFGAIDSGGNPSSVSAKIIQDLRTKFNGLIISDEINMRGLRNKYFLREKQLFIDLVNAGNDIIIDGSRPLFSKYNFDKKINYIKDAVESGKISEKRIDESVKRILKVKGYNIGVIT